MRLGNFAYADAFFLVGVETALAFQRKRKVGISWKMKKEQKVTLKCRMMRNKSYLRAGFNIRTATVEIA
eukprot:scaffold3033_cov250-Chaetoceros_neogracile.AAC.2